MVVNYLSIQGINVYLSHQSPTAAKACLGESLFLAPNSSWWSASISMSSTGLKTNYVTTDSDLSSVCPDNLDGYEFPGCLFQNSILGSPLDHQAEWPQYRCSADAFCCCQGLLTRLQSV